MKERVQPGRGQGWEERDQGQQGTDQQQRDDARYKWLVLVTVVFGAFASILDSTIVNTALPTIQKAFSADLHTASYVATAYILAAGALVPATAFLANRFGIKKIYLLSLSVFTAFSVACGFAPNIGSLIVLRILQGAGGAALFPLSFALLFAAFPENERGKANGIFGIPVLVAPALGPTLGGYLAQYVDWRWIFFVNLPVGILGVVMGLRFLREAPPRTNLRFDWIGFLLAGTGLALLLYGLSNLAYDGWSSVGTVSGPIIAALVLLGTFVPVELRRAQPLLNLKLYTRWNFSVGTVVILLATVGLFGPAFLLPQYLQGVRGQSPFQSGLLLLWQGVGAVVGTILAGQLFNRLGVRVLVLIGGILLSATSFVLAGWISATANLTILAFILAPRGFGLPFILQSTNTTSLQGIQGESLPQATTLNVVTRNVMASFATAALTNLLDQRIATHISAVGKAAVRGGQDSLPKEPSALAKLPMPIKSAIASGYHDTLFIAACVVTPALFLGFLLRPAKRGETNHGQHDESPAEQDGTGQRRVG